MTHCNHAMICLMASSESNVSKIIMLQTSVQFMTTKHRTRIPQMNKTINNIIHEAEGY